MFGGFKKTLYLCQRFRDDSSFYPARASVTAQPSAWAFFIGREPASIDSLHCGYIGIAKNNGCHPVD